MAYRVFAIFLVVLLAATGCRTAQVDNEQTESTAQGGSQRLADDNTIPSGTELRVELNQKLSLIHI